MEVLIAVVIVALVVAFVAVPFRASTDRETGRESWTEDPELADLEARKQAKYREIRDTELDHAQGKLSESEFRRQNAELRAEAIAILREIDAHSDGERTTDPAAATDGDDESPGRSV